LTPIKSLIGWTLKAADIWWLSKILECAIVGRWGRVMARARASARIAEHRGLVVEDPTASSPRRSPRTRSNCGAGDEIEAWDAVFVADDLVVVDAFMGCEALV
jgi:hypothetical protein